MYFWNDDSDERRRRPPYDYPGPYCLGPRGPRVRRPFPFY